MLSCLAFMARLSVHRRRFVAASLVAAGLAAGACLKSLDESLIPDDSADASSGAGGAGGSGGAGGTDPSGGVGGTAGAAGAGAVGGSGGTGGSAGGGAAGSGGQPEAGPTFTPYDRVRFPVRDLQGSLSPPIILAADAEQAYRTTRDAVGANAALVTAPFAPGTNGVPIATEIEKPQALIAPIAESFVFVAAGEAASSLGVLWRVSKSGDASQRLGVPAELELLVGIAEGAGAGVGYASARASAADKPAIVSFAFADGAAAETLYTSSGEETGGDITEAGGCVYWISNGNVWLLPKAGGERRSALASDVTDAVGITADDQHIYYTRSGPDRGEVWQRQLSASSCEGAERPETRIAWGFSEPGDLAAVNGKIVWPAADYQGHGPGIYMTPIGGIDITQIAPGADSSGAQQAPDQIAAAPIGIVFSTKAGRLRTIPRP